MIIKIKTTTLKAGSFNVVKEVHIEHKKGERAIAIQVVMPPEHQVPVIEVVHKESLPLFAPNDLPFSEN